MRSRKRRVLLKTANRNEDIKHRSFGFHEPQKDRPSVDYTDEYLRREHGRLVARFLRLRDRAEVTGLPDRRVRRIEATVRELISVERLMLLDELGRRDRRQVVAAVTVSRDDVQARIRLMVAGAGIEVPR